MNSSAYSRQAWRISTASMSFFFEPSFLSTFCSIGQAVAVPAGHVGRVEAHHARLRTTTSFRILFSAVPRWMCPLA